ncbi:MAG: ion transporter [Dehalococcoidia bacterium]|nr:ion transporter [Dehalococcoidia bacterium]
MSQDQDEQMVSRQSSISMKQRLHGVLERSDGGFSWFDIFIIVLICLNVVALIVETVDEIHDISPLAFRLFDTISVAIFTVEYVLRLWSCTAEEKYGHPVWGRLRFALTPVLFIDLLAILPFYVALMAPVGLLDLRILRFLRAVRLLARIARLSRYSSGLRTSVGVIHAKRAELITVIVFLSILLLMASSLMYFAETEAQPDKFANIPQSMWWSIITLTTVGYGDAVPVTVTGRFLAGVIAILGIGLFALPAGILGSGFMDEMNRRRQGPTLCPHCQKEIHE